MTECVIIAGGELKDFTCVDMKLVKRSFVICADSGLSYADKLGIVPDLIVGDFDSLGYVPRGDCDILTYPVEKDDTDLMLAIRKGIEHGATEFTVYGALGGRLDHTIGNIQCLSFILENGGTGRIISENEHICLVNPGEYEIENIDDFSLSLVSYNQKVKGLTLSGTKYDVDSVDIDNNFPIGVSNKIEGDIAKISFTDGKLLIIQSRLITLF